MSCEHKWEIRTATCAVCKEEKDSNEDWVCICCSKPVHGRYLFCSTACGQNQDEIFKLQEENERLRAALEWYADHRNWKSVSEPFAWFSFDGGQRARAALAGEKRE